MIDIGIIAGSTRPNRRSQLVASWVKDRADSYSASSPQPVQFHVLDLAAYELPLLDEPAPAAIGSYQNSHTHRWAEAIDALDGFVFVTPEYNHGAPAALKNAIDYLFLEWNDKAAGFVRDRKSTRLNSSHVAISYAVFCLKQKKKTNTT